MIGELMIGAGTVTAAGFTYARRRRIRLYRNLEGQVARIASTPAPDLADLAQRELRRFTDRFAVLLDLLPVHTFAAVKAEAERLVSPERSFVPTHKKGGTVAYETLIASAPAIVALYHCANFKDVISRVVGVPVHPTPINDQSSLSVLFYDKPGDHIGWHYDHNFYRGRHFHHTGRDRQCGESRRRVEPRGINGANSRAGNRRTHAAERRRGVRGRADPPQGYAAPRRRAAPDAQHDLLHRSESLVVAEHLASHQRHRLLRHPRALDLNGGRVPDGDPDGRDGEMGSTRPEYARTCFQPAAVHQACATSESYDPAHKPRPRHAGPQFHLNLNRPNRGILELDHVDNRAPPPLSVRH
jgi:hypothetical protein